jgi:2Fe-2S ferredoxin
MSTNKDTITVNYINSMDEHFSLELSTRNPLYSLMELIREDDYEDWGECLGRAWCRTCHVSIDRDTNDEIEADEAHALSLLSNRHSASRLACQIVIGQHIDGATLSYLGDG